MSATAMTSSLGPQAQVQAHARSALTSLPAEITTKIIDDVPFESQLDAALTCRRLAECAHGVLSRHQDAHAKYRIASDRDPATVRTLLRSVFGLSDPIPAWHVRSFESWDLRRLVGYDGFPNPPHDGIYRYADGFAWEWLDGEVDTYLQVFDEAGFPADLLENLRAEMRGQRDAALKIVLFSTLPRLRDIKLARAAPTPGSLDSESSVFLAPHEPYAWLSWLRRVIEKGVHLAPQARGLQGLESLAIAVKTGDEVDDDQRSGAKVSPKLFSQLLRLPRLSSLYLHRLSRHEGDEDLSDYEQWRRQDDGIYDPPPGSSILEHLYLDGIHSIPDRDYFNTLMAAPKAVRTAALRSDEFAQPYGIGDIGGHATRFFEHQSDSIESVMVYNPDDFSGYRSRLYDPNQDMTQIPARQFSLAIEDIFLGNDEKTSAGFAEYLEGFMSWNLEVLVLHGADSPEDIEDSDDPLDDAIFALLRRPNEHNLKSLYLCGLEEIPSSRRAWAHANEEKKARTEVRFQKSITMGVKQGVDVITRTTRRQDLINGEPIFPRAMDQYDLMTGRFGGQRPPLDQGRLFGPVMGTHSAHLCDHCGECDECLAVYPRELWEKTREKRAWARAREWHDWTEPEWFDEQEAMESEEGEGEDGDGEDDGKSDDLGGDGDDKGGHNGLS